MKNLLSPLKKILTSLTGEETEDKNIVAVVDKIADAVENNGSSKTDTNNLFIINIIPPENIDSTIFSFDKTAGEIIAAIDNEMIPIVTMKYRLEDEGTTTRQDVFCILTTIIFQTNEQTSGYMFEILEASLKFYADNENDYPVTKEENQGQDV